MKLAKTISVGGEVGSNSLHFAVSVQWARVGGQPMRRLYIYVGKYALPIVNWSQESRDAACGILSAMLASSEPDLCKYLTRALMEVEL